MTDGSSTRLPGTTAGLPLLYILASFPIALFSASMATDVAYMQTTTQVWADFSAWMLFGAEAGGVAAAVVGLVVLILNRRVRRTRPIWPVVVGAVSVLITGFINNLVHSRDAWTSVVPTGLSLSVLTVIVMLVTAWFGFAASVEPVRSNAYVEAR